MKKMITNTVTKLLLAVMFVITQFSAFAADGNSTEESRWQVVARMPQFWIGVVLFIAFLTGAIMAGKRANKNEIA